MLGGRTVVESMVGKRVWWALDAYGAHVGTTVKHMTGVVRSEYNTGIFDAGSALRGERRMLLVDPEDRALLEVPASWCFTHEYAFLKAHPLPQPPKAP